MRLPSSQRKLSSDTQPLLQPLQAEGGGNNGQPVSDGTQKVGMTEEAEDRCHKGGGSKAHELVLEEWVGPLGQGAVGTKTSPPQPGPGALREVSAPGTEPLRDLAWSIFSVL